VFKHQLANLITPKESRTLIKGEDKIKMRKAPEARREVDSKVSEERVRSMHKKDKNNKSEKHGRYIKEIEGEPKEAALDTCGDQKDDPKNSLLLKK
jgi:hypothetical protein